MKQKGVFRQIIEEEKKIMLPLTAHTLKLLECLPLPLENPELLDYILRHKADAFRQIYDRGWVKLPWQRESRGL